MIIINKLKTKFIRKEEKSSIIRISDKTQYLLGTTVYYAKIPKIAQPYWLSPGRKSGAANEALDWLPVLTSSVRWRGCGGKGGRPLSCAQDAVIAVQWKEEIKASIRAAVPRVRACAHTRRCVERVAERGGGERKQGACEVRA